MKQTAAVLLLVLLVVVLASTALAQSPQQTYTIDWWTVDGGGRMDLQGGGYALGGTAGQPDPGVLSGSGYELGGGFWGGGIPTPGVSYSMYLPLVTRNR